MLVSLITYPKLIPIRNETLYHYILGQRVVLLVRSIDAAISANIEKKISFNIE